jgi:hypothetical protein
MSHCPAGNPPTDPTELRECGSDCRCGECEWDAVKTATVIDAYVRQFVSRAPRYDRWIATHYPPTADVTGKCAEATAEMAAAFPELRRVRGHYVCHLAGRRQHWWLVDEAGAVVDPTRQQFASGSLGDYEPHDETSPEPVGKCMGCGRLVYAESPCQPHACSERCAQLVTQLVDYRCPECGATHSTYAAWVACCAFHDQARR